MLASVRAELGSKETVFKFSTRAQARVERTLDKPISIIMGQLAVSPSVNAIAEILAASWNDGKGCHVDMIFDLIDEGGKKQAGDVISEIIKAAFPPEEEGDTPEEGQEPKK